LALARTEARVRFDQLRASGREFKVAPAAPIASYALDGLSDGKIANRIVDGKPGKAVEAPKFVADGGASVAERDGENGFTVAGVGTFKRTDPFSLAIRVRPPAEHAVRAVVVHKSKAPADAGSRGYEIVLEDGRVAFGIHYMWPGASIKVVTKQRIPADAW